MHVEKLIKDLASIFTKMQNPAKKRHGLLRAASVFAGLGFLFIIFAVIPLTITWLSGNWQGNSVNSVSIAILGGSGFVFLLYLAALFDSFLKSRRLGTKFSFNLASSQAQEQAQKALISAMIAPDDELLPPLDYAPEAVNVPQRRERIVSLADLSTSPVGFAFWRLLGTPVYMIGAIGQLFVTPIMDVVRGNTQNEATYLAVDQLGANFPNWFLGGLLFGIIVCLFIIWGFKGRRIFVNGEGLWWRHFGRWVHLPWADIQSISAYVYEDMSDYSAGRAIAARYYIAGKNGLVQWELRYAAKDRIENLFQRPQRELEATERLLAITMQQTGLPLRDLQPLADALGYSVLQEETVTSRKRELVPAPDLMPQANTLIAAVPPSLPIKTNWRTFAIYAVLFIVVCFGPYAFVRYSQDTLFPRYLASLPAKLAGKTPLLHDPLTQAANGWPLHAPDAHNGDRLSYADGGYTIINGGNDGTDGLAPGSAILPNSYGAIAIQVTLRFNGTAQSVDTSGAGLIIRRAFTTSTSDSCELLINNLGEWRHTCGGAYYYPDTRPDTFSPYIHQGFGVANTLLVIARGQFTAFYINGHLLGYDFGEYSKPFGYTGLDNRSLDMRATFTDFTVWRINPPPDLSYV
ncbi:MAG: hypothetical protein H0X24_14820 [Ktedonobacterales bacterium]|nr:hypothetical protein [Ktedonobacterales bacterium]